MSILTKLAAAVVWKMEEYDEVYSYLESGTYPEGLSKDSKRN